jgi:hypothetical protein
MPTFLTPSFSEIEAGSPIPAPTLAYFRERFRNRLHQLVLKEFIRRETAGLKRAVLAKRLGKRSEQITRWLGAPGNWTLDTVSDLLLGMGRELSCGVADLTATPEIDTARAAADVGTTAIQSAHLPSVVVTVAPARARLTGVDPTMIVGEQNKEGSAQPEPIETTVRALVELIGRAASLPLQQSDSHSPRRVRRAASVDAAA